MTLFEEGLLKLKIDFSLEQIEKLDAYADAVLDFNKSYNLMKADDKNAFFTNHVLDSLAPYHFIKSLIEERQNISAEKTLIGDIGSGGGCPGIPLAVAFPEAKFILVERMEKRCAFLESAVLKLNLKNVSVMQKQADCVEKNIFDIEVFRAFHPFDNKICKLLKGMLKDGGYIAAYKARSEKIAEEMAGIKNIFAQYKVHNLLVPGLEDHERNLVVIKNK